MELNNRIIYSISFLVLTLALLYTSKPDFMFNEDGSIKPFGTGKEKTIYSLGSVTMAITIISFFIFSFIDLISENK